MPLWRIYVAGNNKTYVGILVKCPIFCQLLTKFGDSRQIFVKKTPNIKFHGNRSGGSRADTCGRTDRQMDRH